MDNTAYPSSSALGAETPAQQQTMTAVAEIWERFKGTMADRVAVLEQAAMALLEDTLDDDLRQQVGRAAHQLTSSLSTFGFTEGSRLAREIEHMFQTGVVLEQTHALHLSELVVALGKELERPLSVSPPRERVAEETRPLLLIVDDDVELAERLIVEATARGIRAAMAQNLTAARQAITRERPHVILLALSFSETSEDGLTLLAELAAQASPIPVMVMAARDTFVDRVEVARLGGRGFLPKPMQPAQLLEAVMSLLSQTRTAPPYILAVDDDPQGCAVLRALLEPHGFKLTALDDPRRFWDTLVEIAPDLLLLDVDMPYLDGTVLCHVVRNDLRWRDLPVLCLTTHTDTATAQRILTAGADDYVGKPIVGPELVARINNHLARSRLLRSLAETDALTGLANRRKATQVLGQLLRLAGRHRQPLSLAVLDLDHFKQINAQYGYGMGDEVLQRFRDILLRSFRSEDIVARWGGGVFVVGMYSMPRDVGVNRFAEVLEALRQEEFISADGARFHVTFSAGVAEYPTDGSDVQALYRAAEQAMSQAKEAGRNRVFPAGWHADQELAAHSADIVLVDNDETLAGLVLHALEMRGYHSVWLQDGEAAVNSLTGPQPQLQARVVLLDVNLPGLDGLAVLRRLAQDGVLWRTRVIMLTFRSAESEVVAALELGAVDHVAKPFSLPVLLQRIRRTLQA